MREPLSLEVLEERIAPAGGVTVTLAGGNLTITGDGLGNDIVIDRAGLADGEVRVASGADATTINGAAEEILQGFTGGFALKMGDGDDRVTFDGVETGRGIVFDGQAGANRFDLTGDSIIHGSVIAKNANTADISGATVAGDVKILNRAGPSSVSVTDLDARGMLIRNGDGSDTATFNGVTLARALSIRTGYGYGDNTVQITDCQASSVSFVSGWGSDSFSANGLTCTSGGVALRVSDGPDSSSVSIQGSVLGGSIVIVGDMVDLDDTVVRKSVTAVGGLRRFHAAGCVFGVDAANHRYYGVNVGGTTGHLTELIDVEIGGSFRLSIYPGGLFTWGWPIFVNMDGVTIDGNLVLSAGNWTWGDADFAIKGALVSGVTVIKTLYGDDSITIDDSTFLRSVTINTRWGNDVIEIEANGAPDGPVSGFAGALTVLGGDGDDKVTLGVAGEPGNYGGYGGRVLLDGGADTDTLNIPEGANTFETPPAWQGFETINT